MKEQMPNAFVVLSQLFSVAAREVVENNV